MWHGAVLQSWWLHAPRAERAPLKQASERATLARPTPEGLRRSRLCPHGAPRWGSPRWGARRPLHAPLGARSTISAASSPADTFPCHRSIPEEAGNGKQSEPPAAAPAWQRGRGGGRGGGHAPRGQAPSAPMARPVARFSLLDKTHKRKPALPPRGSTPPLVSGRARRPAAVTSVFRRTRGGLGRCRPPLGPSWRSRCLPHGAHLAAWPRVGSPCSGTPHDGLGQAAAGVQNGDRSVHVRPRPRRGPGLAPKLRRAPGELARVFRARHALAPRGCAPALRHDAADRQAAGGASAGRAPPHPERSPGGGCGASSGQREHAGCRGAAVRKGPGAATQRSGRAARTPCRKWPGATPQLRPLPREDRERPTEGASRRCVAAGHGRAGAQSGFSLGPDRWRSWAWWQGRGDGGHSEAQVH